VGVCAKCGGEGLKTTREQAKPKRLGGVTGKGFRPGQSGNPGGRPKGLAVYIRDKTKDGREIVDFWLAVLRGERPDGVPRKPTLRDMLQAASELADRGFGKARQPMDMGFSEDTDASAVTAAAELFDRKIEAMSARLNKA